VAADERHGLAVVDEMASQQSPRGGLALLSGNLLDDAQWTTSIR
jgi:hypothetical protein